MSEFPYLPYILVGSLTRDFIIAPGGKPLNDIQGGHLFYAAAGLYHWEKQIGLVSRIGTRYPSEWLEKLRQLGMDTRGIKQTNLPLDQRFFISFSDHGEKSNQQPLAYYAEEGLDFPKELLGYSAPVFHDDSLTERSIQTIIARDIPSDYLDSRCIHFCPMDFLTHNLITQHFLQHGQKIITMEAGDGYMVPSFYKYLPNLVHGITAFITSESKIRRLFFEKRIDDLWQMADEIAGWGIDLVVVMKENHENLLLDKIHRQRVRLKAYSTKIINLVGISSAFCGGFIAGLNETYDPALALVYGNVAASWVFEGNNPYYSMDVFPGLTEARIESMKQYLVIE